MSANLLVYGSYGYTGSLVVDHALSRGLDPILAGRRAEPVERQADELGCSHRVFSLEHPTVIADQLADIDVLLNCAGPFSATADPLVSACLATETHYLDVTGEYRVIERIAERDRDAEQADITLLPAVGFDVVPTDCLAATLASDLPDATRLELAIDGGTTISQGTAKSLVEGLGSPGAVRRDGRLEDVPAAWNSREIDFGDGPESAITIPWGDVVTAFHSTGIGDIEVYTAVPEPAITAMQRTRPLGALLRTEPVQRLLKGVVELAISGPSPQQRAENVCRVWGRVTNDAGESATGRLRTPDPYETTKLTTVEAARRLLEDDISSGFQTPATAFGADFATEFEGIERVE
ncbi:saccharopine dehydrogenase family protein [Natranaeroarchaeum aerophilus]|uniref:Saccharopine dehydrogenase NADP-binding domain-containing protein n=1 Tax=Natranaeroarchaeum aerophilus TaxID=2917711 RepID=A0AAE3K7K3_9EURY|nr:saccharopine dehydrogenase NADP-binding domain-containing protein [Natranaeroarchaeum aerophilus]MCL9814004.1 saccharopine dehydrogenase NADP-binding domain-containing protein [Natranaeroarchaeum aerophilus]